jgi:hypothetical protein
VVLLRKSIPQNHNLKTAAELGVTWGKKLELYCFGEYEKAKANVLEMCGFGFLCTAIFARIENVMRV